MASVYNFWCDANNTISQIIQEEWETEESLEKTYSAVIIIQSYFRGMVVRNHMKKLHHAATIIQKNIRVFLVKIKLPTYLLAFLEKRALSFYDKMATKIQALFRGFRARKLRQGTGLDFSQKWQGTTSAIKPHVREQIENNKHKMETIAENYAEMEAKEMVLFILFKVHHLLRTHRPGILSDYNTRELSWIENLLKSLRFTEYMKELRNVYNSTYEEPPERPCIIKGHMRVCEKAYYKKYKGDELKPLPPNNTTVFKHEKPFKLSSKIEKKYIPFALTKGKYKLPITDILRDLDSMDTVNDFDVTRKIVPIKKLHPDYYTDFWKKICQVHQFPQYK